MIHSLNHSILAPEKNLEIMKKAGLQWPSGLPEVTEIDNKKEMFLYKIQLLTLFDVSFYTNLYYYLFLNTNFPSNLSREDFCSIISIIFFLNHIGRIYKHFPSPSHSTVLIDFILWGTSSWE